MRRRFRAVHQAVGKAGRGTMIDFLPMAARKSNDILFFAAVREQGDVTPLAEQLAMMAAEIQQLAR